MCTHLMCIPFGYNLLEYSALSKTVASTISEYAVCNTTSKAHYEIQRCY